MTVMAVNCIWQDFVVDSFWDSEYCKTVLFTCPLFHDLGHFAKIMVANIYLAAIY